MRWLLWFGLVCVPLLAIAKPKVAVAPLGGDDGKVADVVAEVAGKGTKVIGPETTSKEKDQEREKSDRARDKERTSRRGNDDADERSRRKRKRRRGDDSDEPKRDSLTQAAIRIDAGAVITRRTLTYETSSPTPPRPVG